MTSREFIKILTFLTLSVFFHIMFLKGIPTHISPDIKFKRRKTEMTLRPFRPVIPQKMTPPRYAIKKGEPSPGIAGRVEEKGGKNLEEDTLGETKQADDPDYNEYAYQEMMGKDVDSSVLKDFLAMIKSQSYQDRLKNIKDEKRYMWKGGGVSAKDLQGLKGDDVDSRYKQGYLDPRVKVVVVSYPSTGIEDTYPPIIYPDLLVKKHELQSGWCNVVIRIYTDGQGNVHTRDILRPTIDTKREKLFLDHTLESIKNWRFEAKKAEILIDVRYFVE